MPPVKPAQPSFPVRRRDLNRRWKHFLQLRRSADICFTQRPSPLQDADALQHLPYLASSWKETCSDTSVIFVYRARLEIPQRNTEVSGGTSNMIIGGARRKVWWGRTRQSRYTLPRGHPLFATFFPAGIPGTVGAVCPTGGKGSSLTYS
ncbi:hypothetical protein RRG08_003089 [Elysia crispata]|uniref:Uncharacterized protein n=1 Tax=Elysia crispata TaxID=231223 RepID=A0AAE1EC97_9GAST|nr:hypothetical protein RRG08_003089 [Elysia crispata]